MSETAKYEGGYSRQELELAIKTRQEKIASIRQKLQRGIDKAEEKELVAEARKLIIEVGKYQEILNNPKK
jgi:hypothetical protein